MKFCRTLNLTLKILVFLTANTKIEQHNFSTFQIFTTFLIKLYDNVITEDFEHVFNSIQIIDNKN